MKKTWILAFLFILWASSGFAATVSCDGSFSDCSTKAGTLDYGDTLAIGACADGSCVWTDHITITKNVTITGTGVATTFLTSGFGATTSNMFFYFALDATALANVDEWTDTGIIDISGITFKGGTGGATYHSAMNVAALTATPIRRFRLHDCAFVNLLRVFDHSTASHAIQGNLYGSVDSNTLTDTRFIYYTGADAVSWDDAYIEPGSADNLYFEDNTCTSTSGDKCSIAIDHGGRYVLRYNTTTGTIGQGDGYWEFHGNSTGGIHSSIVTEIYGNNLGITASGGLAIAGDMRGGKSRVFFNIFAEGIISAREEYSDAGSSTTYDNACAESGPQLCGVGGCKCQKLNDTYVFNNRNAVTGTLPYLKIRQDTSDNSTVNSPAELTMNREFWMDSRAVVQDINGNTIQSAAAFDGTMGVGCGALAARPATCTTGVGYWATAQSCTDLTGLVGVGATAITGTLYKCTATNTWTASYTPYAYPHPLRGEATTHTVTSSKVGSSGTLSYEGASVLNDGDNSQIYTATVPNGWRVTWSGTGGCTGNGTTCQVLNVTGDVTVIATFTEIQLMPW